MIFGTKVAEGGGRREGKGRAKSAVFRQSIFYEVMKMILNFTVSVHFGRKISKKILFAVVLVNFLPFISLAQTNFSPNFSPHFSQGQFSRLPVLTRARFFENEILMAAKKQGVDPNILWTIAYLETRFRPWMTSPKKAQGLMQFIPSSAAGYDLINPYESAAAISAAARYVKVLSNCFGGRVDSILAAYNSGEGTVSAYLTGRSLRDGRKIINPNNLKTIAGVPPYSETVLYVGRGLKIYRWLIRRGTFPVNFVRANFPTIISAAVARVNVTDPELGKLSDFNNLSVGTQSRSINNTEIKNEVTPQIVAQNNGQNSPVKDSTEIYYEPRTGNRYQVMTGNKTKLNENGIVIIDNLNRPLTTNKARSTFFAFQQNK